MKAGHYLKEKPSDAWITSFIEEFFAAEDRARAEAARPTVTLSLSEIEHIRRDAAITRERLLTEEEQDGAEAIQPEPAVPPNEPPLPSAPSAEPTGTVPAAGLDETHTAVLTALIEGNDPAGRIRAERLIPSVVTDRINEALFELLGDNALECDGNTIALVEDYRDDIAKIVRGETG